MRVLHAYKVYRPDVEGGIPEVISQLTKHDAGGDRAEILVARDRGRSRRFLLDGVEVRAIGSFGQISSMPISPAFPFALRRAATDFDVLALHMPFPLNDIGLALGVPNHLAVVVHWHADIVGRSAVMPIVSPLIDRTLARADRIVVSHPSILAGSRFLTDHAAKCVSVPYGIESRYWSELDDTSTDRVQQLRSRHPRLIVSLGRLVPYKGFPILLRALSQIDAELVIIGEGSERDNLTSLAQQLGVADRVVLPGFLPRDEVKAYLHAARVFTLPSVTSAEAFGLVQIEAMAVGLPVVNTALPTAVPTIARHEHEGITVPVGDFIALADALTRLLDNPQLVAAYGQAGRRRVAEIYDQTAFRSAIRTIYETAMRDRRSLNPRPGSDTPRR